jgi:hypothetical protein
MSEIDKEKCSEVAPHHRASSKPADEIQVCRSGFTQRARSEPCQITLLLLRFYHILESPRDRQLRMRCKSRTRRLQLPEHRWESNRTTGALTPSCDSLRFAGRFCPGHSCQSNPLWYRPAFRVPERFARRVLRLPRAGASPNGGLRGLCVSRTLLAEALGCFPKSLV